MTNIISILKKSDAVVLDSHIVLTSGRHSPPYINKDYMYIHTQDASKVGKMFANSIKDLPIDIIAAPAMGGIVLSQWTAYHLSKLKGKEVLSVYTEKDPEKNQVFTRGYDKIVKGKNVFVVEDLVTTGQSVKKVVKSVKGAGGKVIGVGVMVDRSPLSKPVTERAIGAAFFALGRLPIDVYEADDCILCVKKVPINTSIGHGKKFLAAKK